MKAAAAALRLVSRNGHRTAASLNSPECYRAIQLLKELDHRFHDDAFLPSLETIEALHEVWCQGKKAN